MAIRPLIKRARAVFHRTRLDREEAVNSSIDVDTSNVNEPKTDQTYPVADEALPNNGAEVPGVPFEELQHGVKDAEAIAQTWSKPALIAVLIKYVNSLTWLDHRLRDDSIAFGSFTSSMHSSHR